MQFNKTPAVPLKLRKKPPLLGSNNPYALTQQSRGDSTGPVRRSFSRLGSDKYGQPSMARTNRHFSQGQPIPYPLRRSLCLHIQMNSIILSHLWSFVNTFFLFFCKKSVFSPQKREKSFFVQTVGFQHEFSDLVERRRHRLPYTEGNRFQGADHLTVIAEFRSAGLRSGRIGFKVKGSPYPTSFKPCSTASQLTEE